MTGAPLVTRRSPGLLGGGGRLALPALSVAGASLLMALPLPLAWSVMPHLALLMLLLWAAVQPGLLPPWLCFLLGLLHDCVSGAPLGLTGALFLFVVLAVRALGRQVPARGLLLDRLGGPALLLAAFALAWQMEALLRRPVPLAPLAVQALLTCLLFPAAVRLVAGLQRRLSGAGA